MTDPDLMDANCIHGLTWWECEQCAADDPDTPPWEDNE